MKKQSTAPTIIRRKTPAGAALERRNTLLLAPDTPLRHRSSQRRQNATNRV
jgi:hypothetical protein